MYILKNWILPTLSFYPQGGRATHFLFYKQLEFQGGPKVVYENGQNRPEKLFILVIGCLYFLPNKQLFILSGPKVVYIYTYYF